MFRGKRERDVEKKEKSSSSRKRTRFVTPINPSQCEGLSQEKELTSATLEHPAPSHTEKCQNLIGEYHKDDPSYFRFADNMSLYPQLHIAGRRPAIKIHPIMKTSVNYIKHQLKMLRIFYRTGSLCHSMW
ncbi:PREDICTED: uncharacterized protein LOC109588576 [Amphimedon queenslandica]|uniref:Uncharacterized protein n=1 Tax=Amphimedon queenslandica TaxID=400682 RepID=A0AAN0JTR6_AMPQE|nr:PREDICTED: uncharacterized protein LOC109588576 [Amphimedon queenslandica]|eukprot:XP_019860279.1 PREDICTED: uncharacterized protein LOC109588576 [Amphimedon queenslandica]